MLYKLKYERYQPPSLQSQCRALISRWSHYDFVNYMDKYTESLCEFSGTINHHTSESIVCTTPQAVQRLYIKYRQKVNFQSKVIQEVAVREM